MTEIVYQRLSQRGYTAAEWTASNDVLKVREIGLEIDTDKWKWGDGVTGWNSLPYIPGDISAYLDTDGTLAANSDAKVPSQKAVKTYVDQIIAAQDAMVFKGVIDCSANPNYPAADRGWTYRASVSGRIGGGSGVVVQVGDIILCLTDGTASGNQATVGSSWAVIQANIDGALLTTDIGVSVQAHSSVLAFLATASAATAAAVKTILALVKGDVGLGNADNTSDASKPVSTATQTALDLKANLNSPTLVTPTLGVASATSIDVLSGLGVYSYIGGNTTGHRSVRAGADASGYATIQATGRGSQIGSFFDLTLNPSGGDVGIGTLEPTAVLHIGTSAYTGSDQSLFRIGEPGYPDSYGVVLKGNGADAVFKLYGVNNNVDTANPIFSFHRSTGNFGVNCTDPAVKLDVADDSIRIRTSASPASNGTGIAGELSWDGSYLYVCVATNTWRRVATTGSY
jgi:hypothetical protein